MPTHHLPEAELSLPHGWQDQSVTSYVLPNPGAAGGAATLVVTRDYQSVRDAPPADDFLERYIDRQLVEAARRLTGYAVQSRGATRVGGRRALVLESTWTMPNQQHVRQRQAFVRLADRVVIVTLTALDTEFVRHAGVWDATLAGFAWRPGAGLSSVVVRPGGAGDSQAGGAA